MSHDLLVRLNRHSEGERDKGASLKVYEMESRIEGESQPEPNPNMAQL